MPIRRLIAAVLFVLLAQALVFAAPQVIVQRVPGQGVQPQLARDGDGTIHLIYLKGDPAHSDIFYASSRDEGGTWSQPVRVNSQPGSAIALGTVRGPHLALGRSGSIHIAWMGSSTATPKALGKATPMLYTRSTDGGKSFEPERNVIQTSPGLDGGASIAADDNGSVFVAWHAPALGKTGEQNRRVWIAKSSDNGATFATEVAVSDPATGCCGCCGMRLFVANGRVFALYRGASEQINRGMFLAAGSEQLTDFRAHEIAPMKSGVCVMSTSAFASKGTSVWAAWETEGRVYWASVDPLAPSANATHEVAGIGKNRKHPSLAADLDNNLLVAWTEETGWNKGGAIVWECFDSKGVPIEGASGRRRDLPAWDRPATIFLSNNRLLLLY